MRFKLVLFFVFLFVACQDQSKLTDLANELGGRSDIDDQASIINGFNLQPTAIIKISPTTPLANEPIMLDGSKSTDPDGNIASYRWEINGEIASFDASFEVTLDSGFYLIELTVSDILNASHRVSEQLLVKVSYEDLRFDLDNYEEIAILRGASQTITQLDIKNNQLFVASKDGNLYSYPLISNQINHATTLKAHDGHTVSSMLIWENFIFTGSNDNTIKVWDGISYTLQATLTRQENTITQMLIMGGYLLSTSLDKTIQLYDAKDLTPIKTITNSKNGITYNIALGNLLVSSTIDNEIYLRDSLNNFQVAYKSDALDASIDFLLTHNAQLLLISKEGLVSFYDTDGFTKRREVTFDNITAAHIYNDYLLVGSKTRDGGGELLFYNLESGERRVLMSLDKPIQAIVIKEGVMAIALTDHIINIFSNLTQFNKRF